MIRTLLFLILSAVATGQTFEAADVHTTTSTSNDFAFLANGRLEVRGVTLLRLISTAHSIPVAQITGGPSWLDTDRFDITAKTPPGATQIGMANMLRNLLSERFHLDVKKED